MKKILAVICLFLVIVLIVVAVNLKSIQKEKQEVAKFNSTYEEYNTYNLNGLDITTIINKAINNNEKYKISKNEEGDYISDEMYSIKIYITMIINEKTYAMERINSMGMNSFIEYFGDVDFKCTDIKYHKKTGQVSELTFESTEY